MKKHSVSLQRRALHGLLALAVLSPFATVHAEAYPSKPIRWTVGFPAGGGTDVLARTVGSDLGTRLKTSIIVENRPGAAGMIAAEAVAREAADGYNLLSADIAILALDPAIYAPIRYNPSQSFAPVGLTARFPILIAASTQSGIKNIQDLLAEIKKGSLGYGTAGIGTPHHMAMELMLGTAHLQADHVPYKGDAPALQDLAGGQIKVAAVAPSLSLPFFKKGQLVPLAVTGDKRLPQLPDVPTLKELALADQAVYAWQGLVAPAATPPDKIAKLNQELRAALANPDVKRKLEDLGMETTPSSPEEMAAYAKAELERWAPLIKARSISSK